jgi:hypothetical protein
MKYLQIEAIKEDRRRGVLNEAEMKRLDLLRNMRAWVAQ